MGAGLLPSESSEGEDLHCHLFCLLVAPVFLGSWPLPLPSKRFTVTSVVTVVTSVSVVTSPLPRVLLHPSYKDCVSTLGPPR